jgi:hypothetical protein
MEGRELKEDELMVVVRGSYQQLSIPQQVGRTPQSNPRLLLLYRQVAGFQVVYSPWVTLP